MHLRVAQPRQIIEARSGRLDDLLPRPSSARCSSTRPAVGADILRHGTAPQQAVGSIGALPAPGAGSAFVA